MTASRISRRRTAAAAALAGFTLIEILISIVILALGLLGIGVIFPVIIRQQRIATDELAGAIEARNVVSAILLRSETPYLVPSEGRSENVWYWWREHFTRTMSPNDYKAGAWQFLEVDEDNGDMELVPRGAPTTLFPTNTRIVYSADMPSIPPDPEEAYSRTDGRYVWDMAIQPVHDGDTIIGNDRLRVVMFVRRVDARTRDDGLPVAVDSDTGLPTVDRGRPGVRYAEPIRFQGRYKIGDDGDVDRRRIWFNGVQNFNENRDRPIVSQVGQRLIDAYGNTYTVVKTVEEDGAFGVRVDPPVPPSITPDMVSGGRLSVWFVTTPQPAVAVYTFEVTP